MLKILDKYQFLLLDYKILLIYLQKMIEKPKIVF